jgi:mannose-6-phosphate isomerase-like protein (cupin superfamily)
MIIVKRPWGNFKEFSKNKKSTVKILEINPFQSLSLQKHKKREEFWYFLTNGFVQIGNLKKKIRHGRSLIIKKNVLHKLYAKQKKVKIIEISFGHFDENDEVRVEDKYGRIGKKTRIK